MTQPPLVVLVGPTAVGKTAVAVALAERLGAAEIVSVDSRQIYRGMVVGTAQPTADELARVPHHLVGERDPAAPLSAAEYAALARERIAAIRSRGNRPLLVGGAGLYFRALIDGLTPLPMADAEVRKALEARFEADPIALYDELTRRDPVSAAAMDPTKRHRLIRALEVIELTGIPLSEHHARHQRDAGADLGPTVWLGLDRSRDDLASRIERRTDHMLADGLLDETTALLPVRDAAPVMKTVGYAEALDFLDGRLPFGEMRDRIARHTRQYAKRQLTWFRRDTRIRWQTSAPTDSPDGTAAQLLSLLP